MCNQNNKIQVTGKQTFMGMEIPVIEGGFGEDCKCVTDKTISEIHDVPTREIRRLVKDHLTRFRNGIDYIDLKDVDIAHNNLLNNVGYSTMEVSKAKNIFLLSERGYAKLIKIMDSDKAWEIHDQLIDEYFSMRETLQNTYDVIDLAMLKVLKAKNKQEAMIALQEYNELVVQPLQDTIEKQKPMVGLAEMRIDKKGCYSLTDVTKSLHFKRGQITKWAKAQGFIHKTLQEVNQKGEEYFKVYSTDGIHNQIGITESGLEYISQHIEEITEKSA